MNELARLAAGRAIPPSSAVLCERLEQLFGFRLRLQEADEHWLTFQVDGMTDYNLFIALQNAQDTLFPEGISTWHILCPAFGSNLRGISIRELKGRSLHEYAGGFCYY